MQKSPAARVPSNEPNPPGGHSLDLLKPWNREQLGPIPIHAVARPRKILHPAIGTVLKSW
jgi:hypothetical protein